MPETLRELKTKSCFSTFCKMRAVLWRIFHLLLVFQLFSLNFAQKLLVILSSGFAGSYYYKYANHSSFKFFEEYGVWTDFLYPEFPSLSLPNQYTLVTGKIPVNHGIVGDYMFDSKLREYFGSTHPGFESPRWWNRTEPIWITAQRQSIRTALYYWPGCQVDFGLRPAFCLQYSDVALSKTNVKTILAATKEYDLVLAYHNQIERSGSQMGPKLLKMGRHEALTDFADMMTDVIAEVRKRSDLNVMVVSDHGMAQVEYENQRFLDDYISPGLIQTTIGYGAVKQIIPVPENGRNIYRTLRSLKPIPNVNIYYTDPELTDIPMRFNFYESNRVSELLLVAQPGYGIYTRNSELQWPKASSKDWKPGISGYDNRYPDMFGVFFAYGPAFKRGYRKPSARLLDVYSLMCNILAMKCADSDGELNMIQDILKTSSASLANERNYVVLVFITLMFLCHSLVSV